MNDPIVQIIAGLGGAGVFTYIALRMIERYLNKREDAFNARQEKFQQSVDAQQERMAKTFDRLAETQSQQAETTLKLAQYAGTSVDNLRAAVATSSQEAIRQGDENATRIVDEIRQVPGKVHDLANGDTERVLAAIHEVKSSILRDVIDRMDALEKKAIASLNAPKEGTA